MYSSSPSSSPGAACPLWLLVYSGKYPLAFEQYWLHGSLAASRRVIRLFPPASAEALTRELQERALATWAKEHAAEVSSNPLMSVPCLVSSVSSLLCISTYNVSRVALILIKRYLGSRCCSGGWAPVRLRPNLSGTLFFSPSLSRAQSHMKVKLLSEEIRGILSTMGSSAPALEACFTFELWPNASAASL